MDIYGATGLGSGIFFDSPALCPPYYRFASRCSDCRQVYVSASTGAECHIQLFTNVPEGDGKIQDCRHNKFGCTCIAIYGIIVSEDKGLGRFIHIKKRESYR